MKLKSVATAIITLSIAASPLRPVMAGDLGAGLIGALIGGVIVSEAMKDKRRKTASSGVREQRRQTQVALNYFNFPAGVPDGVFGARIRTAISNYQYYLGFPATGALTDYENSFLLTSYLRAQMGGPTTMQQIASNAQGTRGLLVIYRDEMVAGNGNGSGGSAQSPIPTALGGGSEEDTAIRSTSALPTFGVEAQTSLASHCNKVSLLTNANGGFASASSMSNPTLALNEQFCLARTYAISDSEALVATVLGYSATQIQTSCEGIAQPMHDLVAAASLQPRTEVVSSVAGFVLKTGMSPAQLSMTARICLGVGYRTDNLDVAIASSLLMVALGKPVYGELIGHHLAQGIGASQRIDLATDWFNGAITALDSGAEAAFAPTQTDRVDLLRLATAQLGDTGGASTQSATFTPIPVFKATE
jgi:hypothetical protein